MLLLALLFTLLVPAAGRRIRLLPRRTQPVIFRSPLERPG
jgi:hypothetical protein